MNEKEKMALQALMEDKVEVNWKERADALPDLPPQGGSRVLDEGPKDEDAPRPIRAADPLRKWESAQNAKLATMTPAQLRQLCTDLDRQLEALSTITKSSRESFQASVDAASALSERLRAAEVELRTVGEELGWSRYHIRILTGIRDANARKVAEQQQRIFELEAGLDPVSAENGRLAALNDELSCALTDSRSEVDRLRADAAYLEDEFGSGGDPAPKATAWGRLRAALGIPKK